MLVLEENQLREEEHMDSDHGDSFFIFTLFVSINNSNHSLQNSSFVIPLTTLIRTPALVDVFKRVNVDLGEVVILSVIEEMRL